MSNKSKGIQAEREIIHLFWKTGKWTACRVAGSGSMRYPSPDIIANKQGIHLAIECKKTKSEYQYFEKDEIKNLLDYSEKAGARALVAIRFPKSEWKFIDPFDLKKTPNRYVINPKLLELKGINFDELTKNL